MESMDNVVEQFRRKAQKGLPSSTANGPLTRAGQAVWSLCTMIRCMQGKDSGAEGRLPVTLLLTASARSSAFFLYVAPSKMGVVFLSFTYISSQIET